MDTSLTHHIIGSHISIRDAAMIMAGIEPLDCLISFKSDYSPFDPNTNDEGKRRERFIAKKYFDLLMEELTKEDSCLEIVNLVAYAVSRTARHGQVKMIWQEFSGHFYATSASFCSYLNGAR